MKLTIGDVTLENNVILAPMAGVTDLPFRLLCKEQGAGLLCMEMVSAKAIYYNNKNPTRLSGLIYFYIIFCIVYIIRIFVLYYSL